MNQTQTKPTTSIAVLRIIYLALLVSLFFHGGRGFFVERSSANSQASLEFHAASAWPEFNDVIEPVMIVFSLALLAAAMTLPRYLWQAKGRALRRQPDGETPGLPDLIPSFMVPWIIRLALLEAVAICGSMVAVMKHAPERVVPYLIVSLIGFLFSYPTEAWIRSAVTQSWAASRPA